MIYRIKETGEEFEAVKLWPSNVIMLNEFFKTGESITNFTKRVGIKTPVDRFSEVVKVSDTKLTDNNSCRTCKYYTHGFGLAGGDYGYYKSCDFKKEIADSCKKNNFNRFEER